MEIGIYISRLKGKSNELNNIKIYNNKIYDCRRQGITIITGKDIEIYNNEINNIKGTLPQSGIDLEANDDWQIIDNVKIYRNKIYNLPEKLAIICSRGVHNVRLEENDLDGSIYVYDMKEIIEIQKNNISNGKVIIKVPESLKYTKRKINYVKILNNNLKNVRLEIGEDVNSGILENNMIENTEIKINSTNVTKDF